MPRTRFRLAAALAAVLAVASPGVLVDAERPVAAVLDATSSTGSPATLFAAEASPAPTGPPVTVGTAPPAITRASQIVPGSVNRTSLNLSATYDASLSLNYGTRAIAVSSTMTVANTSGSGIDRLELNTIAARLGAIVIGAATVDGRPVTVTRDDQTLVVPLGGVLPGGATTTVRVSYRATLRSDLAGSNWMFTRTNGIVDMYRWLPWVSRRIAFDRPNHGDPFVTPVSPSVRVRVTTDRPLVLATTGDVVARAGLTTTLSAQNVRDFTVTAAPDYRTASKVVGQTTIRVYYRPGAPASALLSAAVKALSKFNSLLGAYPYTTFNVVQSAGGYGMESPRLIWIPTGVASSNLSYLVHHETAHQWFYGIVGSDQANEPFTDEAATDFVARYALAMRRASRCATARLDLSIYRYSSACYYEVVYIQGGNLLETLRTKMGATAFWTGLRAWIAANRFGIAPTKSLLDTLDASTKVDLVPLLEPRFPRLY